MPVFPEHPRAMVGEEHEPPGILEEQAGQDDGDRQEDAADLRIVAEPEHDGPDRGEDQAGDDPDVDRHAGRPRGGLAPDGLGHVAVADRERFGDDRSRGGSRVDMGNLLPAVDLGAGRSVAAISLGGYHSCTLLDDATLKCLGDNWVGQLGLGTVDVRGDDGLEMGDRLPPVEL